MLFTSSNSEYQAFHNSPPSEWVATDEHCTPFNVKIPIYKNWKSSKKRVLIVMGHVDTEDLREKRLLTSTAGEVITNVIDYAKKWASPLIKDAKVLTAYAAINYNYFKSYHLDSDRDEIANKLFAKRVHQFIRDYNPTDIIIVGDRAALYLLPKITNVLNKRGWIHNVNDIRVVNTIDISRCYNTSSDDENNSEEDWDDYGSAAEEEAVKMANVLGYVSRNIASIFIGKLPFDLSHVQPNPKLVNTIEKFDRLMNHIESSSIIGVDTETTNLNRITNTLLTLQLATSSKVGFVIPIHHKDSPFSASQLSYIKNRVRNWLMKKVEFDADDPKYLIMQNGKFDLTVLRQSLGIPFIYWPIYDLMAGEFEHDENISALRKFGTSAGTLDQIFCNYGNDFYYQAAFGKEDRTTIVSSQLNKDVLNYCSIDTQCLIAISQAQLKKAVMEGLGVKRALPNYANIYKRFIITQMSNNIHMFSTMEHRGVYIDIPYLLSLQSKGSPINTAIKEEKQLLYSMPSVKKANDLLLKHEGIPSTGLLFGDAPFVFDIGKPMSKQILFFKVLKLEPINYGKVDKKTGKRVPKVDKNFQLVYKTVPEVVSLTKISKLAKLKSSYVNSFSTKLHESDDGKKDGRLRPSYGFFGVVTGRSNSSDPSLQQIPTRSAESKYIKRMFAAGPGCLIIKMDYSAHEVRVWSIISGDRVLAEVFAIGRRLRQKLYKTGLVKYLKELELKGDIHRLNCEFFFKIPVLEVTKEQRDGVKGTTFGCIYGKSANSLARDLGKSKKYVEDLYKKFFTRFKKASDWLDWAKTFSKKHFFVYSPFGRIRNLYGYMAATNYLIAAMERRAKNSPIQGMGADIGHTAARLFQQHFYETMLWMKEMDKTDALCPVNIETMVHDSIRGESPYKYVLIAYQILQWCATTGVEEYYKKHFDINFTITPEVEFEFGAHEASLHKHDWSESSLKRCITSALQDQVDMGRPIKVDEVLKEIYAVRDNKKVMNYLNTNFPILA